MRYHEVCAAGREGVVYREPQVSATPTPWSLLSFDIAKNRIAKTFNCSRISIATHATIILDAYKEEKRFRPKIILKRAYEESNKRLFKHAPLHKYFLEKYYFS